MNDIINRRQFLTMIVMFLAGTFIITNGDRMAGRDTWLVIIYGFLVSIPYFLLIAFISASNNKKTIFAIFDDHFGKVIGIVFSAIFISCALVLAIITCRTFTEYVQLSLLPKTPQILMSLFLVFVCGYGASRSVQTIARVSAFLFLIFLGSTLFVAFFSFIKVDFENILPIHDTDIKVMIHGTYLMFTNPYSDLFILLAFTASLKDRKAKYFVITVGALIAMAFMTFNSFKNIILLGVPAYQNILFPSAAATTAIEGNFIIERAEMLIASLIILSVLVRMMLIIKAVNIGIMHYFKKVKENYVTIVVALIIGILSKILFKNLNHFYQVVFIIRESVNGVEVALLMLTIIAILVKRLIGKKDKLDIAN